jgi:hypothetical protein
MRIALALATISATLGFLSWPLYGQMYGPSSFDDHKNFGYSTVAMAPDPPDRGTSLTVQPGHGSMFPAPPFNASVWPYGDQPLADNAEIVRVTAVAGDVLTIARAQEGSSTRLIQVNDQIAATITAKTFTDIEDAVVTRVVHGDSQASNVSWGAYTLRKDKIDRLLLKWVVPPDYAGGDITVRVYLRGISGATGQIRLRRNSFRLRKDAASSRFETNVDANVSFNTADEAVPFVITVSSENFQAGDVLQFSIERQGSEEKDTMNGVVEFHAATYEYVARVMPRRR